MIENIIAEMASELRGDISVKIPQILESKAGGKNLSKWISNIKLPDSSLNEKFRRWQRETIKNNQVTLGLELVDIDLSDLVTFKAAIKDMTENFGISLPPQEIDSKQSELRRRAAEKTLQRLEKASGWVLVEGKFLIDDLSDDYYKCIFHTPTVSIL